MLGVRPIQLRAQIACRLPCHEGICRRPHAAASIALSCASQNVCASPASTWTPKFRSCRLKCPFAGVFDGAKTATLTVCTSLRAQHNSCGGLSPGLRPKCRLRAVRLSAAITAAAESRWDQPCLHCSSDKTGRFLRGWRAERLAIRTSKAIG